MKNDKVMCPLVACSPMDDVADYSSRAHVKFIETTLAFYGYDTSAIEFFTADNCNVNIATAREANVPLVGCASHRLALATRDVIRQVGYQPILDKVALLMDKLTTLKNSDKLRTCAATKGLIAVVRNTTRWTSDWKMLTRFVFLYPHLYSLNLARDTMALIPNPDGFEQCQQLVKILKHFYDATIKLQAESIDMHDIRCIFDALITLHPACAFYLAADASIVKYPDFESAIVKLQSNREDELTTAEKGQLKDFKVDNTIIELDNELLTPTDEITPADNLIG